MAENILKHSFDCEIGRYYKVAYDIYEFIHDDFFLIIFSSLPYFQGQISYHQYCGLLVTGSMMVYIADESHRIV